MVRVLALPSLTVVLFTFLTSVVPMEIDPKTYPSRSFIRFTAQNQILADLTGQPINTFVQRFGGESYVQQVTPGDQPNPKSSNSNNQGIDLRMGLSVTPVTPDSLFDGHNLQNTSEQVSENNPQESIFDEELFEEIAKVTFSPNRYPELYQSCGTQKAAAQVEAQVADEIVATYKRIKQQQECPIVQSLNSLL